MEGKFVLSSELIIEFLYTHTYRMFKLMVGGFYFECECVGWDVCEREKEENLFKITTCT